MDSDVTQSEADKPTLPETSNKTVAPALDQLFISPEEALQKKAHELELHPETPPEIEPVDDLEEDQGLLLSEEVNKITKALDRLSRKGLNMKAVITLLHASNPTISKKTLKIVLDGIRKLPDIYGKGSNSTDPLNQ
jgi:hypothetical protein